VTASNAPINRLERCKRFIAIPSVCFPAGTIHLVTFEPR
jgi:hypothetical protein